MRSWLAVLTLAAAGYALTLYVFYPGVMTYDAKYIYLATKAAQPGDWQSPIMVAIWKLIDPLAPGAASMFLLIITIYWAAFLLLALSIAPRSLFLAALLLVAAALPPAFTMLGIIWRDILFAAAWLLAVVLAWCVRDKAATLRIPVQLVALLFAALGILLRPNALFALPILAGYIVWPAAFRFKRTALAYVPLAIACYALVPLVYYSALNAKRENPLHSVFVFDLGGISHFAKENQFPVTFTPEQNALLINGCYQPTLWDIYWNRDPCKFVMAKVEGEKIFGTPALSDAWLRAVTAHPIAYLQHRAAFMRTLLFADNLTLWTLDVEDPRLYLYTDRPAFMALRAVDEALKTTPIMRAGTWLLIDLVILAFAWGWRETPEGAFAIGACGSATIYVLTFFAVGVAPDFRYAYWAVLAAIASTAVMLSASRKTGDRAR
jgi:hypothetical protein